MEQEPCWGGPTREGLKQHLPVPAEGGLKTEEDGRAQQRSDGEQHEQIVSRLYCLVLTDWLQRIVTGRRG